MVNTLLVVVVGLWAFEQVRREVPVMNSSVLAGLEGATHMCKYRVGRWRWEDQEKSDTLASYYTPSTLRPVFNANLSNWKKKKGGKGLGREQLDDGFVTTKITDMFSQ